MELYGSEYMNMSAGKTNKKIVVFYHGNCPDGFGAAWGAWKKFGNKAEYIPLVWTGVGNYDFRNKELYFLDFTPRNIILRLKKLGNRIVIIDHHLSAEGDMALADEYLFNTAHSGAYWSWKYFHPKKEMPRLVKHISDGDTWQYKMKWTKEVSRCLELVENDFKKWNGFSEKLNTAKGYSEVKKMGKILIKDSDMTNRIIISDGIREAVFEGRKIYVVNSPIGESKIGHELAKDRGMGIVWSEKRSGSIKVSLRSAGKIDVSKIAAKYGGGGHHDAAGFVVPEKKALPWIYTKE